MLHGGIAGTTTDTQRPFWSAGVGKGDCSTRCAVMEQQRAVRATCLYRHALHKSTLISAICACNYPQATPAWTLASCGGRAACWS